MNSEEGIKQDLKLSMRLQGSRKRLILNHFWSEKAGRSQGWLLVCLKGKGGHGGVEAVDRELKYFMDEGMKEDMNLDCVNVVEGNG